MKGFWHKVTTEVAVVTVRRKKIRWIFSSCPILKTAILSLYIPECCVIANLLPGKFSVLAFQENIRNNRKPVTQTLPLAFIQDIEVSTYCVIKSFKWCNSEQETVDKYMNMFVRHCHCHSEQYNCKNSVVTSTVSLSKRFSFQKAAI